MFGVAHLRIVQAEKTEHQRENACATHNPTMALFHFDWFVFRVSGSDKTLAVALLAEENRQARRPDKTCVGRGYVTKSQRQRQPQFDEILMPIPVLPKWGFFMSSWKLGSAELQLGNDPGEHAPRHQSREEVEDSLSDYSARRYRSNQAACTLGWVVTF